MNCIYLLLKLFDWIFWFIFKLWTNSCKNVDLTYFNIEFLPKNNTERVQKPIIFFCLSNYVVNANNIFKIFGNLLLLSHKHDVSKLFNVFLLRLEIIKVLTINSTFFIILVYFNNFSFKSLQQLFTCWDHLLDRFINKIFISEKGF